MKKLFIIALLLLFINNVKSQSNKFYFEAGVTSSKLDLKYQYQGTTEQHYFDPLQAVSFSAGIEYYEHNKFSLSSDLYYYTSGGKSSKEELANTHNIFTGSSKISMECLSIGSTFNYNPLNNKIKLQLSLGPKIDYILTAEKKIPMPMIDKSRGLRKFNYGYTAGIGLFYKMETTEVGLNFRYLGRFQKLANQKQKYDQNYYYSGAITSDQIIMISLSYSFWFK